MAFAPTLTPSIDAAPCPRVFVSFAPVVRTNWSTNPSATAAITGYANGGTSATISRDTTTFSTAPASIRADTTAANSGVVNNGSVGGTASDWQGKVVAVALRVLAPAGAVLAIDVRAPSAISAVVSATGTGAWQRIDVPGALVTSASVPFFYLRTQASGTTFYVDEVLVERVANVGDLAGSLFDGNTTDTPDTDYAFTGTANASTSTQTVHLVNGTQTINVYRTAEGRRFKVRGGVNLYAVGGATVMDYECPFQTPASYQAEQFDASGVSLGFTSAALATLNVTQTWIHQPLSPALAVVGKVTMDSANDFARPTPGQTVWPEGATVGRVIGGQRQGLTQMPLNVKLASTADSDMFGQMFGDYDSSFPPVLCIRTPGPAPRIPRLLFAACLQPHEVVGGINRLITWRMTVDEVDPPAPGLLLPTLRRMDIDAAFPTRAARAAAYATRLARDTDFTKAGLAG